MYSASAAMLEALQEAGVSYIFANFGSDHPALLEAIAEARSEGRPIPAVITCPSEMVAMTCAHGYAQLTGRAQAVVVHVDCGTQSLGGAVHNAAKARIPAFVFAGLSPATQEGEAMGSRNEFIQWIQDVPDQRGIVRQYMKYDNELRSPHNVKQIVHRSLQIAHSDPKGPVYLVGAREIMEAEAKRVASDAADWPPIAPVAAARSRRDESHRRHSKSGAPADRHLLCRPQSGGGDRARPLLRPAWRWRAGVGPERRQLSPRRSALSGQRLEPSVPEPRSQGSRFRSGRR